MKVYLNRIDGFDDAIISMFLSKRTLTRELECEIRKEVNYCTKVNFNGALPLGSFLHKTDKLNDWLHALRKWCPKHITMGRFLDFSFTVYGLHRAGQDDIDSHAKRMENRIIRSSTRLADFSQGEMSSFYEGKIIPTDVALAALGITMPEELEHDGKIYVKGVNGYILKGMENNKDVKRGLYMLSIPSNFIFKERNQNGTANQEVKDCIESATDQLFKATLGFVDSDLLMEIKN